MSSASFTPQHRAVGRAAAWGVFGLGLAYAVTLALGLLSLRSPADPIGDPYFSIMELLIILMAPLMVVSLIAVHAYAAPAVKVYSAAALVFMILAAGLTTCVHFVILTVSRSLAASGPAWVPLLLSFKWPSVAYTLDILAWDWFFALAMLAAAPVFSAGRLEQTVRWLLIVSGGLCLAGLIGVPLGDMQVRNIGIVGYSLVGLVAFLLIGILFGRARPGETTPAKLPATNLDAIQMDASKVDASKVDV